MHKGLILERQEFTDKSITGSFYYNGDFICYSLERPWINNAPFISCVPEGEYKLEYHKYKNILDTRALIGDTVSHFPSNKERNLILIHPANTPNQLHGCIATGIKKEVNKVIGSRTAFIKLMNVIISKNVDKLRII